MKAEIISIGDELLIGQVINTNATWIAQQLNLTGIQIYQITAISDNNEHIRDALDAARAKADIILITGGLGPTKDDITKQCLCDYFNTCLKFNQEAYDQIKELFHIRGLKLTDRNKKQAEIPEASIPIKNVNGTAPGMWFEDQEKVFISMPGVPFEMKSMMTDHILPKLRDRFSSEIIIHKTVLTQGVGESWLAEMISDWENDLPDNIKLAYLPQPGIVRLRLTTNGSDKKELKIILEKHISQLNEIISDLIFGYDDDTLEELVGKILRTKDKTLSTAESCTGGYISHLITSIPGSSDYYRGSVIAYSNEIKERELSVKKQSMIDHGVVSEEVVVQMAQGALGKFNTDYSIATSGIAGP
ncbi:MAG: CinA family nicotinamide mononucleotide deamidase-related protein, partial [Bacteroidales bacterium]|nr:CinA family nicotinamide mononucleotide deamidase-related protein [Bacteroidales bacterium]